MTLLDDQVTPTELATRIEVSTGARRSLARRLIRGREEDARWVRPLLLLLLASAAFLYTVNLSGSLWANDFYSAAVQAATKSWKALFFGSSDAHNIITVDKPPASLWVADLTARVFGFNPWSILLPQAIEGVATVGLIYSCGRRVWTAGTGLLAGLLVLVTPIAADMFRFNNPDPLLLLLLAAATYATLRAVEDGRTRWLVLAGSLVGLAFLTKTLQAFLVVPALGATYLVAGPPHLRRRVGQVLAGLAALVIAGGWWVALVELIPAGSRPYIGGSTDNNELNLIFGYNGIGRLSGSEKGSVAFTNPSIAGGGQPGPLRMFNPHFSEAIAWFLPLAVIGLVIGLWLRRRQTRTDLTRAALLAWGASLVVTAGAFSLGHGIIHPYYSVALAPATAILAAAGFTELWSRRHLLAWKRGLAAFLVVAVGTADYALSWGKGWGVRSDIAVGLIAGLVVLSTLATPRLRRPARRILGTFSVVACLLGPVATTVAVVATPEGMGTGSQELAAAKSGTWLLLPSKVPAPVERLLASDAGEYQWVAAATGSERAASYQLATGDPVIAVGGFNGTDPVPTLAAFQRLVATHQVHWFVAGGPRQWTGGKDAAAIASWVQHTYRPQVVDGTWLYDLSGQV